MDIRDWPLDQVMQLPDCCFGRRFVVACERVSETDIESFDMSEIALPELCVIWSVAIDWYNPESEQYYIRLLLGDQLPASAVAAAVLFPLLQGVGVQGPEPRQIQMWPGWHGVRWPMRMVLHSGGRRLIMATSSAAFKNLFVRCVVEVSSVPKEVPDWLVLGNLKGR